MENPKPVWIISPIKVDPYYEFVFRSLSVEETLQVIEFINHPRTVRALSHFIKYHLNTLSLLLKILPYPEILRLYQFCGFMTNYWSDKLLAYLFNKSRKRMLIKFYNKKDCLDELIILNNQVNLLYNFTNEVIDRRLIQLKQKLPGLDLDEYILGTNAVLLLGLGIHQKIDIIKLYPKVKKLTLDQEREGEFYLRKSQLVYLINELTIIIDLFHYDLSKLVCQHPEEGLFYDDGKIRCLPSFYQRLGKVFCLEHTLETKMKEYKWKNINTRKVSMRKGVLRDGNHTNYTFCNLLDKNDKLYKCYSCKKFMDEKVWLERYVDFCLNCARFNLEKRELTANLSTVTAFVTGIRQKIGLQIALKLLRCGAHVVGTSRFPRASWLNYSKESDFEEWKDRLIIYQVDFVKMDQVIKMIQFVKTQDINIIINNACQTIRPSPLYQKRINRLEEILNMGMLEYSSKQKQLLVQDPNLPIIPYQPYQETALIEIEKEIPLNHFGDVKDVDIKCQSSWWQNIDELEPGEILEANIINQIVPTLIVNQLKPVMQNPKFIINVVAFEGKFNEVNKNAKHAHTNMCKAGLAMMIRTLSESEDKDLHVYAVNPGFISGVNPQLDHYPLSAKDGASRILDPIIQYYKGTPLPKEWLHLWNYLPIEW